MAAAGVRLFERAEGVVGFVEVLKHLPSHLRLLRHVKRELRSGRVGLIILIDYPGFNLRVARAAHDAGVPVLYYITPQVWAWKRGRLRMMAEVITRASTRRSWATRCLIAPWHCPTAPRRGGDSACPWTAKCWRCSRGVVSRRSNGTSTRSTRWRANCSAGGPGSRWW